MRAAVYCRLSKSPEEDGNIAQQEARGLEVVAAQSWTHAETYVDDGVSAWRDDVTRPAFQRLLAAARRGDVDVIVVRKVDRLTRNQGDWGDLSRTRVSVADWSGLVLDSFQAAIEVAVAVRESDNTSQRVRQSEERRVAAGAPPRGGRRHFGYHAYCCPAPDCAAPREHTAQRRAQRDQGAPCCAGGCAHYAVRDDEAAIIREMASRWLDGASLRSLAREMNQRGIPTPSGGDWNHSRLKGTLQSARLAAIRTHRGRQVKGSWEPVIPRELHNRLVSADTQRKNFRAPSAYLLRSLLKCACGRPVRGKMHTNNKRRYICTSCEGGINTDTLDDFVWNAALGRTWHRDQQSEEKVSARLETANRELIEAKERQEELERGYWVQGTIREDTYKRAEPQLAERVANLEGETKRLRKSLREASSFWNSLANLSDHYENASWEDRRALLEGAIERITLHPFGTIAPGNQELPPTWGSGYHGELPNNVHPNAVAALRRVEITWKEPGGDAAST